MMSLCTRAGELALSITEHCSTVHELPSKLGEAIEILEGRLSDIARQCQDLSEKGTLSRIWQSGEHRVELERLNTNLGDAIKDFQITSSINLQQDIQRISNNVERVRLNELPKQPDLSGQRDRYMPDSRTGDVEKICDWISTSTELVLNVHGSAGVGKSTLALHLSDELRSVGRLAASIFLGAFPAATSGPETIVKMLAHEIGSIHSRAIPKILEAIDACHGTSLEVHLKKYILQPLQSLDYPRPLIIIVDAIDEWRDHPTFIQTLAHVNSSTAVVKFIITSRLGPHASRLPDVDRVSMRAYFLRPVSTDVIKAYFNKHFRAVRWRNGRKPTAEEVNRLADLSGGSPSMGIDCRVVAFTPF
ncbi:hypothetical protein H1R20_g6663, partial [Candolleomyces eurysporus]